MPIVGALKNKNSKKSKPPVWFYPHTAERDYQRLLYRYVGNIKTALEKIIYPKIPDLIIKSSILTPVDSSPVRKDDFIDEINDLLLLFTEIIFGEAEFYSTFLPSIALQISGYNKSQSTKFTKDILGSGQFTAGTEAYNQLVSRNLLAVDIFRGEPWLKDQVKIFANQNSDLIKSLGQSEIDRVSNTIQLGLQSGSSYKSIERNLESTLAITKRHAKFIARDQTSKLNGSLTRLRMSEAGITEFIWQTSGDERVRKTHRVLNGKRCRYDNPNVYYDEKSKKWLSKDKIDGDKTNPSQNYNCRCVALPFIEGLYNYDT